MPFKGTYRAIGINLPFFKINVVQPPLLHFFSRILSFFPQHDFLPFKFHQKNSSSKPHSDQELGINAHVRVVVVLNILYILVVFGACNLLFLKASEDQRSTEPNPKVYGT